MKNKIEALANLLKVDPSKVTSEDEHFLYQDQEWLVYSDDEAETATEDYIKESLWTFNPKFIADFLLQDKDCTLGENAAEVILLIQEKLYEDANGVLKLLIGKRMPEFVLDAIYLNGRGVFLSDFDSQEHEQNEFFMYRVN